MRALKVAVWSATSFFIGIAMNWSTFFLYGKMPVNIEGPKGHIIDDRHIIGYAPLGDNLAFPPGWMTSIGDWVIIISAVVLWVSLAIVLVGEYRKRNGPAGVQGVGPCPTGICSPWCCSASNCCGSCEDHKVEKGFDLDAKNPYEGVESMLPVVLLSIRERRCKEQKHA